MIVNDELLDSIMKFYRRCRFICFSEDEEKELCNALLKYYDTFGEFSDYVIEKLYSTEEHNIISYTSLHFEDEGLEMPARILKIVMCILGRYFRFVIDESWNEEIGKMNFIIISSEELSEYKEYTKYEPDKPSDDTIMVPITRRMADCIASSIDCALGEYANGNMYYIEARRKFELIGHSLREKEGDK